jgi:hypothetical protein
MAIEGSISASPIAFPITVPRMQGLNSENIEPKADSLFRTEQVVGLATFPCDSDRVDMVVEFVVHTRFGDAEL